MASETSGVSIASTERGDPPPDGFVCQLTDDRLGTACVYVAAELDIASASQLDCVLRRAELAARLTLLDLRELTFMDSFGLRVIVAASNRAQRAGRRLVLLRGPPQVQRLIALCGAADDLVIADLDDSEPASQVLPQLARTNEHA